jgi:hypothetical protein
MMCLLGLLQENAFAWMVLPDLDLKQGQFGILVGFEV